MSNLHSRIVGQGGQGSQAATHPVGTPSTQMVMPMALVTYRGTSGYYESLYPSPPATADPNHVPLASASEGTWGRVVPAGVI